MRTRELPCPVCRRGRLFETPPCADGHGEDCPELACTGCGTALLLGWPVVTLDSARDGQSRTHARDADRRAA